MNIEKIQINGHYVWVDKDAEIKEGDWYKSPAGIYSQHNGTEKLPDGWCKIIAASPELNLEGVKSYVEWLFENQKIELDGGNLIQVIKDVFIKGYQAAEKELPNWEDVSSSDTVSNEQVALYFQFDDDEPIEGMKCNGKEFTMKMLPVENGFVEFTDGKKRFRMFVRHCY